MSCIGSPEGPGAPRTAGALGKSNWWQPPQNALSAITAAGAKACAWGRGAASPGLRRGFNTRPSRTWQTAHETPSRRARASGVASPARIRGAWQWRQKGSGSRAYEA
ncbi:MAG: hypothetical protein U0325_10980 [Polyangiales bacterium]